GTNGSGFRSLHSTTSARLSQAPAATAPATIYGLPKRACSQNLARRHLTDRPDVRQADDRAEHQRDDQEKAVVDGAGRVIQIERRQRSSAADADEDRRYQQPLIRLAGDFAHP